MIRVTEAAKEKLISTLNQENQSIIRFSLRGGGCSGFQYSLTVESDLLYEDDFEYKLDTTHKLVVDSTSMIYLEDVEIDYKKNLMGESFIFNNNNVKASCGCGTSVSFD